MILKHAPTVKHRFRSRAGVEKFWREVKDVGARKGHRKPAEERYALGLYLLARATYDLIDYPVIADQGEAPDFLIREGDGPTIGLEVTRATKPALQRAMTLSERSNGDSAIDLSDGGWLPGEREKIWLSRVHAATEQKIELLPSYRRASRHDLLIYDDSPTLGVDRKVVLAETRKWICKKRPRSPLLGKVSIIISLDVIYDVDGECRTLPFLDLESPERFPDLGSRVEFAAQKAVRDELHRSGSR